jgi:hypothetical protein
LRTDIYITRRFLAAPSGFVRRDQPGRVTPCGEGAGGAQKRLWNSLAHPPPFFFLICSLCLICWLSAFFLFRDQGGLYSVKISRTTKNIMCLFSLVCAFLMFLASGLLVKGMLRACRFYS